MNPIRNAAALVLVGFLLAPGALERPKPILRDSRLAIVAYIFTVPLIFKEQFGETIQGRLMG